MGVATATLVETFRARDWRHFDPHALPTLFHESETAGPTMSRFVDLPIRRHDDRYASTALGTEATGTLRVGGRDANNSRERERSRRRPPGATPSLLPN